MTSDLNENEFGTGHSPYGATGPTQARKRKNHDCKRRKVKCSGENTCQNCRSREIKCRYSPSPTTVEGEVETRRSNAIARQTRDSASAGARMPPGALPDPRVDELYERVRSIECTLTRLLKSAKYTENSSPGVPFLTPVERSVAVPDEEDDDGDQFALPPITHNDLTLSSQVAALGAFLSGPPSPKTASSCRQTAAFQVLIQFPDSSTLQHLLDVYFCDMNSYFPFLDRQDTELRIYGVVGRLGHSSCNRSVAVTKEDLSIIALTYIMLAMADCVDPDKGACDGDAKPGWERYLQSCRAIQQFSHSKTLNLDTVRAQCLMAAYLMHVEVLRAASQAISVAWQQAISIRLNDKKTWPGDDAQGVFQRQQLWWTMYFLDRQISRRSGIAYHIRNTEFDVDDFTVSTENTPIPQAEVTKSYLQALVSLSRLWSRVWDTFFAVGATNKGDWMEVELMDARILNARRGLPKTLTWDSKEIANYAASGEDEPRIRRRLQIFTRLELLRMLIKQNPIHQSAFNPETAHFCARLSREIIRSHHLYFLQYPARASGYFATSSIVECIYHLAPVIHRSTDSHEHSACVSAFNQAHGILINLSVYTNVAKKALRALNGVIKKWGGGDTIGIAASKDTRLRQGQVQDVDNFDVPPEIQEFMRRTGAQVGVEGFDIHLGDLMDMSMGWLPGSEFDLRPDVLH
ncbi:hypothetical protein FVEG_05844 [Fusarium verticillioides 7600]|uniref:Zn(2)-C6 fungal-type domain-containing protein n=1 Tax=Gibberella moniliformis (strain M3125 / FGSC 7600) TaxID=334819 RepID=W7M1N9_GIBM7|nr:hypothetical protein FVEG_05844 [Fusarium verticillioides 7600]EWG44876.1 hypothetical protein FVEG_05844 [Fusarium verticillioides 7600]